MAVMLLSDQDDMTNILGDPQISLVLIYKSLVLVLSANQKQILSMAACICQTKTKLRIHIMDLTNIIYILNYKSFGIEVSEEKCFSSS